MSVLQLLRSCRQMGAGVFPRNLRHPSAILCLTVRRNHDSAPSAFEQKINSILGIKYKPPQPAPSAPQIINHVKFTGFRTRHSHDGSKYTGNWLDGLYHGTGTMTYPKNPAAYIGKVKEVMSGSGSYYYVGHWQKNKRHGQGELVYPNGSKLVGEFVDNKLVSGSGLVLSKEGAIYEGEVENGKEHGQGKITYADGQTLQGWFKEGRLFKGTGVLVAKDGTISEGEYNFGMRHGECVVTYPDGRKLEGQFKYGKIHNGKGLVKIFDSQVKAYTEFHEVEGDWENGCLVTRE